MLILVIDLDRGFNTGDSHNNMFYDAYKSYPGFVYDMNHNYWIDGVPKGLSQATYDSPGKSTESYKYRNNRGYYPATANGWGEPRVAEDSCWMDNYKEIYYANFGILSELIDTCQERGISLIAVIAPMNPRYTETGAFGYRGLRRSEAPSLIEEIANLKNTYPNFILLDENKMGNHDYTDEMAMDNSHLATLGAIQLTHRIDSLIKTLNIDFEN